MAIPLIETTNSISPFKLIPLKSNNPRGCTFAINKYGRLDTFSTSVFFLFDLFTLGPLGI